MVSTETSLTTIANDINRLQLRLEEINPSYRQSREIYNALVDKTLNPFQNNGLAGDRLSFIIILLEKILRNTEIILGQNTNIHSRTNTIEQNIIQLKQEGLDPIITAGNNITAELKHFETGFQDWNTKFDSFQTIFETWNTGFNNFDTKFVNIDKFLKDFSTYWNEKTNIIQGNLNKIESHITQWNDEIIRITNSLDLLDKRFFTFEQKQNLLCSQPNSGSTSSPHKQIFQVIPSHNHKFTF